MKKFLFFLLVLLLFPLKNVSAADKSSNEYYQELLQNYRRYQGLIEPFNIQRSRHLTYQSVSTQADFLNAAKNLVSIEVESIASYTTFIRTYLAEATRIINYQENYLYVMLDGEQAFLSSSKDGLASLSSLSETQSFVTELQAHHKKIGGVGYQIKSIVELGSAAKTLENIKIEATKIENLLGETKSEEAKIYAAKEKFSSLKIVTQEAEELINQADKKLRNAPKDTDFKGVSENVREMLNQAMTKFSLIVSGYRDIVNSLK